MRLFQILLFTIIIAVLGGCQMTNEDPKAETKNGEKQEQLKPKDMAEKELPEVRAFQDEFTREFLQSTEETRPGYYPFLSGTGAYKMDFPEDGLAGEKSYNIKDKSYEGIKMGVGTEDSTITHTITIRYFNHLENIHKDDELGQIETAVGEDLEFEEVDKENQIFYISEYQRQDEDLSKDVYGYAALILNKKDLGGIRVVYTSRCAEDCEQLKEEDRQEAYDWLMTIDFLENQQGSADDEG